MPGATPALPAQKKGGARAPQPKKSASSTKTLPILQAQCITLEDGTQVPIKIPPGMPPQQAQQLVEFLRSNPEAAKAALAQAQSIMGSSGLPSLLTNMNQKNYATQQNAETYSVLKDDPELKHVFEDIEKTGPSALQKYWDDTDLMTKIAAKLREAKLSGPSAATEEPPQAPATPDREQGAPTLHDLAKKGDLQGARDLIDQGGVNIDGMNERGVTALGVAVGFNKIDMVRLLLDAAADVMARDSKGSTALHYAAGYGRKEVAVLLIERGAQMDALNDAKQTPLHVAQLNGEKGMVMYLKAKMKKESAGGTGSTISKQ